MKSALHVYDDRSHHRQDIEYIIAFSTSNFSPSPLNTVDLNLKKNDALRDNNP